MLRKLHQNSALGLLLAALLAGAPRADDARALDQYLQRLGLSDLRLLHLEQTLAGESAAAKRLPLARTLADAYAEQLLATADEPERFAKLHRRAEQLLNTFPEAATPAVTVAMLQADYQR